MTELRTKPYTIDQQRGVVLNADSPLGNKGEIFTAGQFLTGFRALAPQSPERAEVASQFLGTCIENPNQLVYFGQLVSTSPQLNEKTIGAAIESFTKESTSVARKLPPEVTKELTQNPEQIGQFLDIHYFDPKNQPPELNATQKILNSLDGKVLSMVKKVARETIERTFKNCESQTDIVNVMYNSAIHLLKNENPQNWEHLLEILIFKSPFLRPNDVRTGRYIAAQLSSDEDLFIKYYWLNSTSGTLMMLIRNDQYRKHFDEIGVNIVNSNPGFDEIFKNPSLIISREKQLLYVKDEEERQNTDWNKKLLEQDMDDFSDLLVPPTFPSIITTRPNPLMNLTKRLIALQYCNEVEDFTSVVLPTSNTAYNVFVKKGDVHGVLEKPKAAMHFVYQNGPGGRIENPYAIRDALRWFRPELLGTTFIKLEKITIPKIKKRLSHPKRSLPAGGVHMTFNKEAHPFIEADSMDIDKTGKHIIFTFGNYTIPLSINTDSHLVAQDGTRLDLEENSRSWWEATILSLIADVTAPIEGDEVILSDAAEMPRDDAIERTDRAFVLRGPHMRKLHPGQGFDEDRAAKLLAEDYPFPHIQQPIDLWAYNGIPHDGMLNDQVQRVEREEGQWTYVHAAQPKDNTEREDVKKKKSISLNVTASSLPEIKGVIETQYST